MAVWLSMDRLAIIYAIDRNEFMARVLKGYIGAIDRKTYSVASIELVCSNQWAEFDLTPPASVSLTYADREVLRAGPAHLTTQEREHWPIAVAMAGKPDEIGEEPDAPQTSV